jgi:UDP-N-acetylglucosamine 1-carboxyvinyltransferase
MSKFVIEETTELKGKVKIGGAKNSALPIIAASLLTEKQSDFEEVPYLNDVKTMCELLRFLGAKVKKSKENNLLIITPGNNISGIAPYELVNKMRASFLITGPLLARVGYAKVPLPGGCAIGLRPVDLHLKGFIAMGAEINQGHGYVEAKVNGRLNGAKIYLDFPSVGATENILMASVLADGQTIIENAAIEPEIVDLATYLISMGADIKGAGTDTIKINGVRSLNGINHSVIPDRIEAGTFMTAVAMTGGDILLENVVPDHLKPISAKLREAGMEISEELSTIRVISDGKLKAVDIKTHPYPGFPTDMQAQMTSIMTKADGTSMVVETIFENRFMHIPELKRMGANIRIEGRSAVIEGKNKLTGTQVKTTDLRAGAALIIAGLNAEGITEIDDIEHIDRGYVEIDEKLKGLGVNIKRVES